MVGNVLPVAGSSLGKGRGWWLESGRTVNFHVGLETRSIGPFHRHHNSFMRFWASFKSAFGAAWVVFLKARKTPIFPEVTTA